MRTKELVTLKCRTCGSSFKRTSINHKNSIKSGGKTYCGFKCMGKDRTGKTLNIKRKNYLSEQFNRWTCLRQHSERCGSKGSYYILCECECGIVKYVNLQDLKYGKSKSCGCWNDEVRKEAWSKENNPSWNPDLTDEDRLDKRNLEDYREWRTKIYERDNYDCQICDNHGGVLNAHHLDGWKWCKERRYDVSNGVTLCESCHKEFHVVCGNTGNTEQQFKNYCAKIGMCNA